jgi:hypothetical protein
MPVINNPVMGAAALIAAIVVSLRASSPSSLSALPLRHELLATKAQLQSAAIATLPVNLPG